MYKIPKFHKTSLNINNSSEGETIEMKIERITTLKEPIKDGAPQVYTERKDGVIPAYNIKTDRFEIAIEAMDKYSSSITAERANRLNPEERKTDGKPEPTQGTETKE